MNAFGSTTEFEKFQGVFERERERSRQGFEVIVAFFSDVSVSAEDLLNCITRVNMHLECINIES